VIQGQQRQRQAPDHGLRKKTGVAVAHSTWMAAVVVGRLDWVAGAGPLLAQAAGSRLAAVVAAALADRLAAACPLPTQAVGSHPAAPEGVAHRRKKTDYHL
jgi:hypothetical protein